MQLPTRRWWSRVSVVSLAAFAAIQLVPYGRDRVNPPSLCEPVWDSAEIRALARNACFDCHSNETQWPVYARVAPVSWIVQHDVIEGRGVLNFSEWHRPQEKSTDAAEELLEGAMPPGMYRLMHPQARLSATDRDRLAHGLATTVGAACRERQGNER
jgi:Haem-binding domain